MLEFKLILYDLKILILPILVTFLAQLLKLIIDYIKDKKSFKENLYSSGGFPSVHTTLVTSMVVIVYMYYGVGVLFSFAFMIGILFIYDALNIRYQAGKHAELLILFGEKLDKTLKTNEYSKEIKNAKIKKRLGHTPLEVLGGIAFGILVTYCMYFAGRSFFETIM